MDNSISINNNFCTDLRFASSVMRFYEEWKNELEYINVKTSGSTGEPKEISLTKKAVATSAKQTVDYFQIKENENMLLCLPVEFIAGKLMVIRSILAKAHLVIGEASANPLLAFNVNKSIPLHFAAFTPYQISNILSLPETKALFAKIKTVIIGGGEISNELENKLKSFDNEIYATYGMTETITHIAVRKINTSNNSRIYTAFKGIQLGIDDRGCLTIQAEYLNNKPIITNDIVEFEGPREFIFKGRYDNVINSGGVKLHPELIEQKIQELIKEPFIIYHKSDTGLGQKLVLIIEREHPFDPTTQGLLESSLKDVLQKYEVPKEIIVTNKLQRTLNGKIIRALP